MTNESVNEQNPFEGSEYNMVQFVQLSRIYDVLMTLVQIQSPTACERLLEAHAEGHLVNPSPQYTGEFLFDSLNEAAAKSTEQVD